jgi:hypothetical protein
MPEHLSSVAEAISKLHLFLVVLAAGCSASGMIEASVEKRKEKHLEGDSSASVSH